jgi:4-coumarate--CoA ligase
MQSTISLELPTATEHIYRSPHPSVALPRQSVWTFCFDARGHDPSLSAYIDAPTGRTLSRAQTRSLTLELAYGLRNLMPAGERVKRGDTVLIFSPNSLAWVLAAYGVIANGARLTPANGGYTARELLHQYMDSGARVALVHPTLVGTTFDMFKLAGVSETEARKRIVVMEFGFGVPDGLIGMQDLMGKGSLPHEERFDGEQSNETFLMCYSSGTTGKPKGVEVRYVLSHLPRRCLDSAIQTTHYNYTSELCMTEGANHIVSGQDVVLATLPFYHILGQ